MGLFGKKKEEEHCPICGAVLKYNNYMDALDGKLCSDCAEKFDEIVPNKRFDTSIEQIKNVLEGGEYSEAVLGKPSVCPTCGRSIPEGEDLFKLRDGYICRECERLMRGDFSKETVIIDPNDPEDRKKYRYEIERMEDPNNMSIMKGNDVVADELKDQSIAYIKELVDIEKECQQGVIEEWGNEYDNIFQVDENFIYDLGPIKGGIKNSKKLKDKIVVKGALVKGSFSEEDEVVLIQDKNKKYVKILKVVPCDGFDFAGGIFSGGAYVITAHSYAWMLLDLELEEFDGEIYIVK